MTYTCAHCRQVAKTWFQQRDANPCNDGFEHEWLDERQLEAEAELDTMESRFVDRSKIRSRHYGHDLWGALARAKAKRREALAAKLLAQSAQDHERIAFVTSVRALIHEAFVAGDEPEHMRRVLLQLANAKHATGLEAEHKRVQEEAKDDRA